MTFTSSVRLDFEREFLESIGNEFYVTLSAMATGAALIVLPLLVGPWKNIPKSPAVRPTFERRLNNFQHN